MLGNARVMLFDFKQAFDLLDHSVLMAKLEVYELLDWIANFVTHRKQRVKLAYNSFSEWESVKAGVPQGTKSGPWVFLVMINDIKVSGVNLWKYVDDTSIAETVHKSQPIGIQVAVEALVKQAEADKCKDLQISFARSVDSFEAVIMDNHIDVIKKRSFQA